MRNTIYYKWFLESKTPTEIKEFNQASINNQKDMYISWLEKCFGKKI